MFKSLLFRFLLSLVSIVLMVFLIGCESRNNSEDEKTREVDTATIRIPSTKSTQVLFETHISTKTPTITKVAPTSHPQSSNTPLPSTSPTWTAIPTLHPDEAKQIVVELFSNNGGCDLPCWWGITPGKTTWQEARAILSKINTELGLFQIGDSDVIKVQYALPIPDDYDPYGLGLFEPFVWIKDYAVIAIGTNTIRIKQDFDNSLPGLLKSFGQPNEIWLSAHPEAPDNHPPYDIDLFYSERGIMLSSTGEASIIDDYIQICPQEFRLGKSPPGIVLFPASNGVTYSELTDEIFNREVSHIFEFRLLREITDGFDEAEFYNVYTDPQTEVCIEIKLEKLE